MKKTDTSTKNQLPTMVLIGIMTLSLFAAWAAMPSSDQGIQGVTRGEMDVQSIRTSAGTGYIEVHVLDNASVVLSNALVQCYYNGNMTLWQQKYTDVNGFANITGLAVGWYLINATKGGYQASKKADYINFAGDDDEVWCYLKPYPAASSWIEVTVKNSTGSNLTGAAVTTTYTNGTLVNTGVLGGSNLYNITGLLETTWYYVTATFPGYVSQTKSNYINWNHDDDYLTFVLVAAGSNTAVATVNVTDSTNGNTLASATVDLYNSTGYFLLSLTTPANGSVKIKNLAIGTYMVSVKKNAYMVKNSTFSISVNGQLLTHVVPLVPYGPKSGWIEITVLREFNATLNIPLPNAQIYVYNQSRQVENIGVSDANGFFNATSLWIGWYYIVVMIDGYISQEKTTFINWPGDDDYLSFTLLPFNIGMPVLQDITPNPTGNKVVPLQWTIPDLANLTGTWLFKLYRQTYAFISVSSLTPIETLSGATTSIGNTLPGKGSYFYKIIYTNTSLSFSSNLIHVGYSAIPQVTKPQNATYTIGTLNVNLVWNITDSDDTTGTYSLYKNSVLLGTADQTWTNNTQWITAVDTSVAGTFLYKIVYTDTIHLIETTVSIKINAPSGGIPGYPMEFVWIAVMGIVVLLFTRGKKISRD